MAKPEEDQICEAFDVIRRYAEAQHWMPIGWRQFAVGSWDVTVNGTRDERDHVPPYHAMVAHREVVSFMLLSPFGGRVGGWRGAEDAFIRDMEVALSAGAAESKEKP